MPSLTIFRMAVSFSVSDNFHVYIVELLSDLSHDFTEDSGMPIKTAISRKVCPP